MRLACTLPLVTAFACDRPTGPEIFDLPASAVTNAVSGCYTVRFTWNGTISGPTTVSGPLTGDLIGTLTTDLDFSTISVTGSTMSISGTGYWQITGGVLPAPLNFETAIENRNQLTDRPGSPATEVENMGRHSALSGVSHANLTYRGAVDFLVQSGPVHDYHGVICL